MACALLFKILYSYSNGDFMNCGPMHNESSTARKTNKILLYGILGIAAAYYLWGWHRDHVLQYWPLAIVFLCPLMHLFGHAGHKGHSDEQKGVRQ